jgi:hypothetical protein
MLEHAYQQLQDRLLNLHENLLALHLTITEDRPTAGDVVLIEVFGDAASDLIGLTEEALEAAQHGLAALEVPPDPVQARRQLLGVQQRSNQLLERCLMDVLGFDRLSGLAVLGHTRGGEWRAWAVSVKVALEACRMPLLETNQAVQACWSAWSEGPLLMPPTPFHFMTERQG